MEPSNLQDKLIKVVRTVNIYTQNNEIEKEVSVDIIPLNVLKTIVDPKADDPLLYDGYILNASQLIKINDLIDPEILVNFDLYFYILECAGVYNW